MTALATLLPLFAAEHSPAEEGRNIITIMLLVGLTFLAVIALGELVAWRGRRRKERRRARGPAHRQWREYRTK